MKTNTDFAKHISIFLTDYLPHQRNVSPNTIKAYSQTFVQFISYMRNKRNVPVEKITLDSITKESVSGFLSWVIEEHKCGKVTRNCRLAAICSFIRYLQYEDVGRLSNWQQILGIKAIKTEKRSISYISVDGIKLLLEQPDISSSHGRRNLAILSLMYDTGARVQEIADLTPDNVRIENKPYTIRLEGKGRKSRIVPLMDEQVAILRSYMEEQDLFKPERRKHPLFFNSRLEKLSRQGIAFILQSYIRMAKMINPSLIPDKVSCHSLRHSKAMHLLQAGVNLVYIRDILGHTSLASTDVYARSDSKQKREALEKAYSKLTPNLKQEKLWEKDKNLLEWLNGLK